MLETVSFDDYMDRLHCGAKKKGVPVEATIELTYGCNLNCLHCYNPTHLARNETDTSQIFSILSQLAKLGTCLVLFTGGEIFSRKDIFEILDHTRQKGMQFVLLTNATLITEEKADRLKQLDPYRVCVSLYGATAETYEKVTRVRGSFKKFVRGLDLLLRRKIPVELRSIILKDNLHEFEAMRRFTKNLGLRFDYASEINPRLDGLREPLQHRISPEEDLKLWRAFHGNDFLKKMAQVSSPCKATTQGPFNCRCGKSSLVITPYGKMNLCLFNTFPQENILEFSVLDGWKSLVNLVQKSKPTKDYACPSCPVFDYCTRGPSDSFSEMGDVNTCVPYQKEKAVLKKEYVEHLKNCSGTSQERG
ncbi:MAG: hypothetical protein A3H42_06400 [Deltaproteobacteria bacterium RIFCSPLOWO2_02_FULL_46_8]|nr:MAG: hypothetical protein A3H42_06400 [Deltaproteobacteria bacterium RIFCSPLOWO2_02_FULL_46_8]